MTQFIADKAGNTEAQQKKARAFLLTQDSTGLATDGVLTGLVVAQTGTASASVLVAAGAGVVQDSVGNGASQLVNDTQVTLDVLTANPMGGTPRNDIVVFDAATVASGTGGIRVIVGTPNAVPTDPTVPATAIPLARLRHAASATTVPTAKIDDLRVKTSVFGGADENFKVRGVPMAGASTSKAGQRIHWGTFSSVDVNRSDSTGIHTGISHGAGFTPSGIIITPQSVALQFRAFNLTSTTFDLQVINSDGSANGTTTFTFTYLVVE